MKDKERFLVGVPGIYYADEARAAKQQGFGEFQSVKRGNAYEGAFGYFIKRIKFL